MVQITYDKDCTEGIKEISRYLSDVLKIDISNNVDLSKVVQAFITPGYANEHRLVGYRRLEFLGDAVIREHVSRCLFDRYPKMDQKMMSIISQYLWSNAAYPQYILESGKCPLECIMFARAERNQSIDRKINNITNTVSDCFEALIGALEAIGKGDDARKLIEEVLLKDVESVRKPLYGIPPDQRKEHLECLATERKLMFKDYLRNEVAIEG